MTAFQTSASWRSTAPFQRFGARIAQDVELLRHCKPPVDRHQHRAQASAGIEQHQIVGVIGGEDRDAIAAGHAELRFQRTRGRGNALRQRRVAQLGTAETDRRLVRRERGVAVDEIGEVHGASRVPPRSGTRPHGLNVNCRRF